MAAIDSFTIVGQAIEFPFVIVTHAEHSIRNVPDLVKTAKASATPLLCGVPGAGTPQHLLIEYFSRLAGIKIQVVPFKGGAPALNELLGKRLDFLIESALQANAPAEQLSALRRAREIAYQSAREAVAAGASIAFGTDAGVLPHGSNAREFRALTEIGLSPLEALRSATIQAAELMGWPDRVGALEPGFFADVVGLRGNPLEDLNALGRVEFVMKAGKVIRNP